MGDFEGTKVRRRSFFNVLTSGALIAAASTVPLTSTAVADTETYDEKRKPRYRESDEVKTFYRLTSYPAKSRR